MLYAKRNKKTMPKKMDKEKEKQNKDTLRF